MLSAQADLHVLRQPTKCCEEQHSCMQLCSPVHSLCIYLLLFALPSSLNIFHCFRYKKTFKSFLYLAILYLWQTASFQNNKKY